MRADDSCRPSKSCWKASSRWTASSLGIRDASLWIFEQHGLRPKVHMELGSNEAIKHASVGALGLSVLSLHTLTLDGPVALLDVEGFPIQHFKAKKSVPWRTVPTLSNANATK